jgi:hypothetical protein
LANAVYPKYKNAILQGSANSALTGTGSTGLWAALIDTNDVSYNAAHEFYSDISAGVVAEIEVSTVTTTGGLIDGDNEVFSAVSGDPSEALIYYRKNAGANTTWHRRYRVAGHTKWRRHQFESPRVGDHPALSTPLTEVRHGHYCRPDIRHILGNARRLEQRR